VLASYGVSQSEHNILIVESNLVKDIAIFMYDIAAPIASHSSLNLKQIFHPLDEAIRNWVRKSNTDADHLNNLFR